jgi:hypothetical protein
MRRMEEIKTLQRQRAEAGIPVLYAVTVCNVLQPGREAHCFCYCRKCGLIDIVAPRTRAGVC